jgi:hypothetical protein
VQQRADLDRLQLAPLVAEPLRDLDRQDSDALDVAAAVVVLRLDRP